VAALAPRRCRAHWSALRVAHARRTGFAGRG
jgi:hypothetical protein